MSILEEEHDLGECEAIWGYTCDQCRQEYLERAEEYTLDKDDVGWDDNYK